jgi:hypothetical protein
MLQQQRLRGGVAARVLKAAVRCLLLDAGGYD